MNETTSVLDELLFGGEINEVSIEDAIALGADDIIVDGGVYEKFESTVLVLDPSKEPDRERSLTVRFLPNILDIHRPYVIEGEFTQCKDDKGWFRILSEPRSKTKTWKRWENLSKTLKDETDNYSKFVKSEVLRWGKESTFLIQVLSDSRHPENEGKVFHWKPNKDHATIIKGIGNISDEAKSNGATAPYLYSFLEAPKYIIKVTIDNKSIEDKDGKTKSTPVRNFSGCNLMFDGSGFLKGGIILSGIKEKAEYLAGFNGCVLSSTGYTKPDGTVVPFKDDAEAQKIIKDVRPFMPLEYVTSDGKVFNKKSDAIDAQTAIDPKIAVKTKLVLTVKTVTAEKIAKFEGCEMLQIGYKMPKTEDQKKKNQQGTLVKYTTPEDSVLGFGLIKFFLSMDSTPNLERFMYKPVDPETEARAFKLCDDIENKAEWIIKAMEAKARKLAQKGKDGKEGGDAGVQNAAQTAAAEATTATNTTNHAATGNPVIDGLLAGTQS